MSEVAPKVVAPKVKKPAKPSVHPPVATMVVEAIKNLKEKEGVSLSAIKKYIQSNYKGIDMDRLAPFIRRFLKKAATDGTLTTAKGHAGSFKLGEKVKTAPKPKKVKKPESVKKSMKPKKMKTPKKDAQQKKTKKAEKQKKTETPKKDAKKTPRKIAAKKPVKAAKKPADKTSKKPVAKKPTKK